MIDKDWDEFTDWAAREATESVGPFRAFEKMMAVRYKIETMQYIYMCLLVMARNPAPDVIIQYLTAQDLTDGGTK